VELLAKAKYGCLQKCSSGSSIWVSGLWVTETPLPLPSTHPPHTFHTITSSHTPHTPSHTPLTRPHTRHDSCHDTAPEVSALHATWPWLDTHPPGGGWEWENAPADSNGAEKPGTALQGCCDWSTRSLIGYIAEWMWSEAMNNNSSNDISFLNRVSTYSEKEARRRIWSTGYILCGWCVYI